MKQKLAWGLFVAAVACAVVAVIGLWLRRGGSHPRVPDFKVVERSGKPLTRADLMGHVWIAAFVFTTCPNSCPVMMANLDRFSKRFPEPRFVCFAADPENDTPDKFALYARMAGLSEERWFFGWGPWPRMQELSEKGFLLSLPKPRDHSSKFALIDRYGRIRGYYDALVPEEMARLEAHLPKLLAERALPVHKFPALNAGLNATSALLLVVGLLFIKAKRIGAHRACMLGALAASALFLICYLTYHYYVGSKPFPGQGWARTVYFTILISHTILAAFIVPLAGITLTFAFREQFPRHRAIARWTLPLWLYVSVTGVVIYFMLY